MAQATGQNNTGARSKDMQFALLHFMLFKDSHGKKACRRFGVGAMRKNLGRSDPKVVIPFPQDGNVIFLADKKRQPRDYTAAQMDELRAVENRWRIGLAEICDSCDACCKWARRLP